MTNKTAIIQGSFPGGKPHASVLLQAKLRGLHTGSSTIYQIDSRRLNMTSPGQPLPRGVLQKMESVFKTDFSNVRVHTGREAESIGALAFTTGNDIYFATGQYNPDTPHGQRLIGHELTHVVQQKSGKAQNPFGNEIAVVSDPGLEAEAERMVRKVINSSNISNSIQLSRKALRIKSQSTPFFTERKRKRKHNKKSSLKRPAFSRKVRNTLPLQVGEHRRHIIPYYLLRDTVLSWWNEHNDKEEGKKTNYGKITTLISKLNSNTSNLLIGSGIDNTEINVVDRSLSKQRSLLENEKFSSTSIHKAFSGKTVSKRLSFIEKTFIKDPKLSSPDESLILLDDVIFNNRFDWPGGKTEEFVDWRDEYKMFHHLKKYPESCTHEQLLEICGNFLKMKKPSGSHKK